MRGHVTTPVSELVSWLANERALTHWVTVGHSNSLLTENLEDFSAQIDREGGQPGTLVAYIETHHSQHPFRSPSRRLWTNLPSSFLCLLQCDGVHEWREAKEEDGMPFTDLGYSIFCFPHG